MGVDGAPAEFEHVGRNRLNSRHSHGRFLNIDLINKLEADSRAASRIAN